MSKHQPYEWSKTIGNPETRGIVLINRNMNRYSVTRPPEIVHEFVYVKKEEYMPVRQKLEELIHRLQDEVRDKFTFRYRFIGSSSRNMITRDQKGNIGYDFDVDLFPNVDEDEYDADDINEIFQNALNKVARPFGYDFPENKTRVLRIKVKDRKHSRIEHSCDFAIKRELPNRRCQYIHFNNKQNRCVWQLLEKKSITWKEERLKKSGLWGGVRDRYLDYKNRRENAGLKSRSVYRKAIHDVYNEYMN